MYNALLTRPEREALRVAANIMDVPYRAAKCARMITDLGTAKDKEDVLTGKFTLEEKAQRLLRRERRREAAGTRAVRR